jgi:hypothetical protein
MIVVGLALEVIGLIAAAPWGTGSISDADPSFPGAPILFAVGIVLVIGSALLYELLPDKTE